MADHEAEDIFDPTTMGPHVHDAHVLSRSFEAAELNGAWVVNMHTWFIGRDGEKDGDITKVDDAESQDAAQGLAATYNALHGKANLSDRRDLRAAEEQAELDRAARQRSRF